MGLAKHLINQVRQHTAEIETFLKDISHMDRNDGHLYRPNITLWLLLAMCTLSLECQRTNLRLEDPLLFLQKVVSQLK